MRRTTIARWALALVLFSAGTANATTWYVNSAAGIDTANGKSPGTAFLTLQHAAGVTAAGDTVNIRGVFGGGTGGTAPLVISTSGSGAGTAANTPCTNQIVYQTDPLSPVRAQINGTQALGAISGTNPLSCITINNLEIAGWNGVLTWAGASVNAGLGGTSWQSAVYNGDGIFFGGTTGGTGTTSVHHIMVTNNVIHDFPGNCVALNFGDYLTVTGNTTFNCAPYAPAADSGISLYELHNIDAGTGTKNYIANNIIYNNADLLSNHTAIQGTTTGSGTSTTGATTVTVASSAAANFGYQALDVTNGCIPPGTGGQITNFSAGQIQIQSPLTCNITGATTIQIGLITDGEGVIIDDNTNAQSDSVAYVGRTLVTNNVVFGNGSAGLQASPTSKNVDITFNTVYQNQTTFNNLNSNGQAPSEINVKSATGVNVYNNLAVGSTNVPSLWDNSTSTTVFANSAVTGGNGSHTVPGTGNITGSPLLVNPSVNPLTANFQLQPGSPAISAGSGTFTRTSDFAGNPGGRGSIYDIGAFAQPCIAYGKFGYLGQPQQPGSACSSR